MFVARIHNNSLGTCVEVSSEEEGIELIKKWIKDQFQDADIEEMSDDIENNLEWNSDDYEDTEDTDNCFTFALGDFS